MATTTGRKTNRFSATIGLSADREDGGYYGAVIELPGCVSEGESEQECLENVKAAFREMVRFQLEEYGEVRFSAPKAAGWETIKKVRIDV